MYYVDTNYVAYILFENNYLFRDQDKTLGFIK